MAKSTAGQWLADEWNLLQLALGFLTRIPMRANVVYSPVAMHRCSRYFPFVGWLQAGILSALFLLFQPLLGEQVSIVLIMMSSVVLTGAFHEDGLADTCDGLWGGLTPERKIDIMKDSRIGTYGACGLLLSLLLRFVLLSALAEQGLLILALCLALPLSRAFAVSHVQDLPYVSHQGSVKKNKSDPLAKPLTLPTLAFVFISGGLACVMLPALAVLCMMLVGIMFRLAFKALLKRHIGGYTGDNLGAAQQCQELLIYLSLLAMLNLNIMAGAA